MLVAVCDQLFGTSTSSWRESVTHFSFPVRAVAFSHSTASHGGGRCFFRGCIRCRRFPAQCLFHRGPPSLRALGFPLARGNPPILHPLHPAEVPRIAPG